MWLFPPFFLTEVVYVEYRKQAGKQIIGTEYAGEDLHPLKFLRLKTQCQKKVHWEIMYGSRAKYFNPGEASMIANSAKII